MQISSIFDRFICPLLDSGRYYHFTFISPPHDSGGVSWFHIGSLCVCPSGVPSSIFLFPDDGLSECQWVFTKLGMCIDIVRIWFGIANGQISSIFDSYLPQHI